MPIMLSLIHAFKPLPPLSLLTLWLNRVAAITTNARRFVCPEPLLPSVRCVQSSWMHLVVTIALPLSEQGEAMTEAQMLVMLGTIWVAPHVCGWYGKTIGCIILLVAACKGLGWI
jgi:hypothetical protein